MPSSPMGIPLLISQPHDSKSDDYAIKHLRKMQTGRIALVIDLRTEKQAPGVPTAAGN